MLVLVGWALTAGALSGCSSSSSMNPINWWHREEGGKIAQQRPMPPGANQAYPNLATVPAKPAPVDQKALDQLTNSLIADRTNAQHAAEAAPLADPSSPTASPNLFGVGTAPPPPPAGVAVSAGSSAGSGSAGTPLASASIPAVTAPPAAPSPAPSPAPRKPVRSAPLEAPAGISAADASGVPTAEGAAANASVAPGSSAANGTALNGVPGTTVAGVSPALPAGPPPRPAAAGEPPVEPPEPAPMPAPSGGPSARIVFLERASNLSPPASDEVKAFASKRGNRTISVVGYGDSVSSDPDAQSAALDLGLSRAQSIVDALKSAGVPGNAIRVSAEASGRGASLRVIQ